MPRPGRLEYFMQIAHVVSTRATCQRAQVGAVIVDQVTRRIVGVGYNGAPPGIKHCDEEKDILYGEHCVRTIHAEINAMLHLSNPSEHLLIAYCTHRPCWNCLMAMYTKGVTKVFYETDYGQRYPYLPETFFNQGLTVSQCPRLSSN